MRLFFTFLLAAHNPGEETPGTRALSFDLGQFLVKFLLFSGKRFRGDNFYPDQQIPGLSTALHPFSSDLQCGVELYPRRDFQINVPLVYCFDFDCMFRGLPGQD